MLTDAQILRIAASELGDLHGKEPIDPGHYSLSAEVRFKLRGSIEQGEIQLVTPTASIPLLSVLALVAQKLSIKAEHIYDLIVTSATEALERGEPVGEWIEHSKRALATVKENVVQRLPKVARTGQCRRIVEVTEISVGAASLSPPEKKRRRKTA